MKAGFSGIWMSEDWTGWTTCSKLSSVLSMDKETTVPFSHMRDAYSVGEVGLQYSQHLFRIHSGNGPTHQHEETDV